MEVYRKARPERVRATMEALGKAIASAPTTLQAKIVNGGSIESEKGFNLVGATGAKLNLAYSTPRCAFSSGVPHRWPTLDSGTFAPDIAEKILQQTRWFIAACEAFTKLLFRLCSIATQV